MDSDTLDRIRSNDHRTLSRVISQIENDGNISDSFFKEVHTSENKAIRIGITGPPGAGKSTLTNVLIQQFIDEGKSVGVESQPLRVTFDPVLTIRNLLLLADRAGAITDHVRGSGVNAPRNRII